MICTDIKTSGSGISGGAIAGACIGGLLALAILGFFVWRSRAKKNMRRMSMAATAAEKENDFGMLKSARASTHTVASIASTVRTRASNVIQIAYIPGVTNRSGPTTPAHLIPPIPPLPYSDSPMGSQFPRSPNIDIQFAADDLLRGSMITVDNRSSIATTIYGGNAVVSQPNIIRAGKAAVVTVKGGSSIATSSTSSPNPGSSESIPPVPALFISTSGQSARGKGPSGLETVPPSPTFSVGSTFLNRMNIKNGSDEVIQQAQKRVVPGRSHVEHENHSTSSVNYDSDDSSDLIPGHRGNALLSQRSSGISSCITDMEAGSPFSDAHSTTLEAIPLSNSSNIATAGNNRLSLNFAGGKRSSKLIDTSEPARRTVSPFDDSHSVDKLEKFQ